MSSQPGKFTGGSVSVVALPVRGTIEATCSLASCLHVDIRAASRVRHAAKTLSRRRVDHARQGHHPTPHLFVSSPLGAHWTRPWLDGDGNDCAILCYVFTCWVQYCSVLYYIVPIALSIVLSLLGRGCWMVGSGPCMDSSSRPGNATTLSLTA